MNQRAGYRWSNTRRALWAALFAMLLQVLIPALHAYAMPIPAPLHGKSIPGLCLAPAKATKTADSKSKPLAGKVSCPLCQNSQIASGGAVPPDSAAPIIVRRDVLHSVHAPNVLHVRYAPIPSARPRAPPSII